MACGIIAAMPDPIRLEPPPRRYTLHIEHHHDGRVRLVIKGVGDGQATRETLRAILREALASMEENGSADQRK